MRNANIMETQMIEIDSFKAYDSIFPNREVVTREILNLIKTFRSKGYLVIVKPNDSKPVEYLFCVPAESPEGDSAQ